MSTPIASQLSRGATNQSPFPLLDDNDIKGTFVTRATLTLRDNMPEYLRKAKMFCYVTETDTLYQLGTDTTISGQLWSVFDFGVPSDVVTESELFDGNGKIKTELIDVVVINQSYVVADEAEMLTYTSLTGNIFTWTSTGDTYIKLNNNDPSTFPDDFAELTSVAGVQTIYGETGVAAPSFNTILASGTNQGQFETAVAAAPSVSQNTTSIANIINNLLPTYLTQDSFNTTIANYDTSSQIDAKIDAVPVIITEVADVPARDGLVGGQTYGGYVLTAGKRVIVNEVNDRNVYQFTGGDSDSGAGFWQFRYALGGATGGGGGATLIDGGIEGNNTGTDDDIDGGLEV